MMTNLDRRSLPVMLLAVVLGACGGSGKAAGPVDRYELEGEVMRVDEKAKLVSIKHGDIKSKAGKVWMAAMTMEFPVKEAKDLEKLKAGAQIRAAVFQQPSDFEYWIAEVEVVKAAAK